MKRFAIVGAALVTAISATSAVAHFDHPAPSFSQAAPLSTALNAGGDEAEWELVATIPTGNPHTDLDFFTSGGETYASVGTLANGPNGGGQTIVKLTNQGRVEPSYVSEPSVGVVPQRRDGRDRPPARRRGGARRAT